VPAFGNTDIDISTWLKIFDILLKTEEFIYTVFQKSDAKLQITITTAYQIRINYPLSIYNYRLSPFLAQMLQISTKSTTWFLSNGFLNK